MLLLLLLACLEYNLPVDVMRATLETAKLTNIGYVHVHELRLITNISEYCTCSPVLRPYSSVSRACVGNIREPGDGAAVHVCIAKVFVF